MIGEIDPQSPDVKYLIVAWDTKNGLVDLGTEGLSCFDVAGLLAVALELAAQDIPTPQYDTEESE